MGNVGAVCYVVHLIWLYFVVNGRKKWLQLLNQLTNTVR